MYISFFHWLNTEFDLLLICKCSLKSETICSQVQNTHCSFVMASMTSGFILISQYHQFMLTLVDLTHCNLHKHLDTSLNLTPNMKKKAVLYSWTCRTHSSNLVSCSGELKDTLWCEFMKPCVILTQLKKKIIYNLIYSWGGGGGGLIQKAIV